VTVALSPVSLLNAAVCLGCWLLACRIRQLVVASVLRIPAQRRVAIDSGGRMNEDSKGL
jgi:hypothetical protein